MLIEHGERSVNIYPYPNDHFHSVTVSKPYRSCIYDQDISEVNWGCFGSVNADDAELYANAILEAAKMARQYTKEFAEQQTTAVG